RGARRCGDRRLPSVHRGSRADRERDSEGESYAASGRHRGQAHIAQHTPDRCHRPRTEVDIHWSLSMTQVAHVAVGVLSVALIGAVLWDAFETVILPRSVVRRFRLARTLLRAIWFPWRFIAARVIPARRERFLAFFGPLVLLALIAVDGCVDVWWV